MGAASDYSLKNPYIASFGSSRSLCAPETGKEVCHVCIDVPASDLPFEVGDSLCVLAENHPQLVSDILAAVPCDGSDQVLTAQGETCSLQAALSHSCGITKVTGKFLKAWAELCASDELKAIAADKEQAKAYYDGRDFLDIIVDYPAVELSAQNVVDVLGKVIPRLYSIASSQNFVDDAIELCIGVVEWEHLERQRHGLCSTYLCHRLQAGDKVRIYIHHQKKFKVPTDINADVIMIGPGTGIAPFRAFMQERDAAGGAGRNWLYFGDWQQEHHYHYADEWKMYQDKGSLHHLDLAFSRDQDHKIYVQHLLEKNAAETWKWIDGGGHIYVCGDAKRMAKDVDAALHKIIAEEGGMSEDAAADYVQAMKKDARYQRDVY